MADELGYLEARLVFISPSIFPDLSKSDNVLTDAVVSSEVIQKVWGKVTKHRLVLACKSTGDLVSSAAFGNDFVLNVCAIPRLSEEIERVCSHYNSAEYIEMKQEFSNENKNALVVFVSEKLKSAVKGEVFKFENFPDSKLTALVRIITPLPLSKVVLGAKTEESYHWANSELQLLLTENTSNNCSVLRECELLPSCTNQTVEFLSDIHIMHCEPLLQGTVTPKTCIVVLQLFGTSEAAKLAQNDIAKMEAVCFLDSPDIGSLLVSDFTNILTDPPIQTRVSDFSKASTIKSGSDYSHRCLKLGIFLPLHYGVDLQSQGFVSLETLLHLSIFHGRWVQIQMQQLNSTKEEIQCVNPPHEEGYQCNGLDAKLQDQQQYCPVSETEGKRCHAIQLSCNENETSEGKSVPEFMPVSCQDGKLLDNTLYISPLLYFNLTGCCYQTTNRNAVEVSIQPVMENPDEDQEEGKHSATSSQSKPPFADQAHVALIASPYVKSSDSFDVQLMDHFSIPRLLTVGDIFLVKYDWRRGSNDKDTPEDQKPREVTVYFKVMKLSYKGDDRTSCFVDSEHSSLYQKGVVNSYVPALLSDSMNDHLPKRLASNCSPRPFWHTTNLPGLELQVDLLEKLIKPYLENRKSTLHPSGILVTGPLRVGKTSVVMAASRRLNLHVLESNCYDLCGESVAAMEARIRNLFQKAVSCSPCVLLLRNIHALGKDREGNDDEPRIAITMQDSISNLSNHSDWPVATIATSSSPKDISPDMFSCFLHEVAIDTPSEEERCDMLMSVMSMARVANDVSIKQLARKTAGFVLGDFVALLSQAAREATKNTVEYYLEAGVLETEAQAPVEPEVEGAVRKLGPGDSALQSGGCTTYSNVKPADKASGTPVHQFPPWYTKLEADICSSGVKIHNCDVEKALESLQASQSDAIGAPKIPSVKWEDVGGLVDIKADILDTIQLPLQHPELFAAGLRRSGVLLYGPPGTGKTLLAKAVATECSLNFLSVKGPELINMYVGQSEQNVREVFARAQSASPCVIFFDELDSLAPNRGRSGDSGGVMDRVVSQLLAELDGLGKSCDVFVIGATNRPDLLDPALLRPGRFDKMLYLGVSKDHESQLKILEALTRRFSVDPRFSLETFSGRCPLNLTGADLYALCSDAMLQAVKRNIARLEQADVECNEHDVQVGEKDFLLALENLIPSVSFDELRRFEVLQQQFALSK